MEQVDLFLRFGVALGVGFLIGLEREYSYGVGGRSIIAGERTLSLLSLAGFIAAMLSDQMGNPSVLVVVIGIMGLMITSVHYINVKKGERTGITTEAAIMISILVGALCYYGFLTLAVAIGIATTVILSLKLQTDRFVQKLTRQDISAALQFAVISVIVLPILPNQSFFPAPFDVLNPFSLWLMVVFISAVSFLGYVLIKVIGPDRGIGVTGLLGGLVSSTAVTMSFSGRSRSDEVPSSLLGQTILISWMMMFVRVLVEIGVVNYALLAPVFLPVGAILAGGMLYNGYLYFRMRSSENVEVEFGNPFQLSTALKFGLIYAGVLLVAKFAQMTWGDTGIIISSILTGLVNMTATTLTVAQMSASDQLSLDIAVQAILMASLSNTLMKTAIVMVSGSNKLRRVVLPGAGLLIVVTTLVLVFR